MNKQKQEPWSENIKARRLTFAGHFLTPPVETPAHQTLQESP